MAVTPEEVLRDAIDASGSLKLKKFRDTIQPPLHQVGLGPIQLEIYET